MQNLVSTFIRRPAARENAEPTLKPQYEVKETPEAWGLTVYLPGVAREGLELTAEEGLIPIRGRRHWKAPAGWTTVYRESVEAAFELALSHDNTIDVTKIHAELHDGVLRVSLPKAEAIKPRKIAVN
jgi:HSP20 family molecular chaperone IbpA